MNLWGTPGSARPANEEPRDYTVCGLYLANGQRWSLVVHADSARAAEDKAMAGMDAAGDPQVTGVFYAQDGRVVQADTYAYYLNPDQPAPEGAQ